MPLHFASRYWFARFDPPFARRAPSRHDAHATVLTWNGDVTTVVVRTFISHHDAPGAKSNADAEAPLDMRLAVDPLEAHRQLAAHRWGGVLRRLTLPSSALSMKVPLSDTVRFYTALYHTHLGPTLLGDAANGGFKWGGEGFPFGRAQMGRLQTFHDQYSTFSLWDTYRAQQPLLNLLHPQLARDLVRYGVLLQGLPLTYWITSLPVGAGRLFARRPIQKDAFPHRQSRFYSRQRMQSIPLKSRFPSGSQRLLTRCCSAVSRHQ